MTQAIWAIIPVKPLTDAKSRLAAVLPDDVRRRLVRMMLEDVIVALTEAGLSGRIMVVTPDLEIEALALGLGAGVLRERGAQGLNAAIDSGLLYARELGALQALIVPGDVPLASSGELARVLAGANAGHCAVVLAPAANGDGTNAMLLAPPDVIRPSFGPDSFVRHLAAAAARRIDTQVLHLPGLAADIDTPADLHWLAGPAGPPRYAFLRGSTTMPPPAKHPA
jgi:2-phospho-L-lactate guanylyltransferase